MKISIITIVFNNCDTIQDCLLSVQNQSYMNIEHIVIDGGSTDGTQEKISPFRDNLAYYISEKDSGLYNALNKGIKRATGDIIGILHSDDLFSAKNVMEKVVSCFKETNADLVYAKGVYVDKRNTSDIKRIYPSKRYKEKYLNFGWIPLHTTIFVKKCVFEDYGDYDENYLIASDYEISLRWFTNAQIKKEYLNEWIVKMRLGGKSTTASLQKEKSVEDLMIIKKYKLLGAITLFFKIVRKIPQYILPRIRKFTI